MAGGRRDVDGVLGGEGSLHRHGKRRVAVVMAGCAMTENGTTITDDVSAFLLIKDDGVWRIANQAWDRVDHTEIQAQGPGSA